MIYLKSNEELHYMAQAGKIVAEALIKAAGMVKPGAIVSEIDHAIEQVIVSRGALPSFKGYRGYPAASCISINEQVVHGIPSPRKIHEGDVVSIDIGAQLNGWHADAARTWGAGHIDPENARLIKITRESFYKGLEYAQTGRRLKEVCAAIQQHAESNGFSVVRELTGHGVGQHLHEDPEIPNFVHAGLGTRLEAGMTLAIEPMINRGAAGVETLHDGWTVVTADNMPSAHFEQTIAITEQGPVILTATDHAIGE